jgi:hypothetical protein
MDADRSSHYGAAIEAVRDVVIEVANAVGVPVP